MAKESFRKNYPDGVLVRFFKKDVESNRRVVRAFNHVVGLVDTIKDVDCFKIFFHNGHIAQADEACQIAVKDVRPLKIFLKHSKKL